MILKEATMPLGLLYTHHIEISESSQMLKGRLQFFQELLHFDLMDQPLDNFIQQNKYNFSDFKHELHHKQILAAIQEERYFQPVNSAIDLCRFFMMEYKLPITFHDLKQLNLPLIFENDHVYDQTGKVASPNEFATRTQTNMSTSEGVHIFFFPKDFDMQNGLELLQAAGKMFCHIHGGEFKIKIHS